MPQRMRAFRRRRRKKAGFNAKAVETVDFIRILPKRSILFCKQRVTKKGLLEKGCLGIYHKCMQGHAFPDKKRMITVLRG